MVPDSVSLFINVFHLIFTRHYDVLWFWHDTARLSDKGVLFQSREAVGVEKSIVLLHAEWSAG